MEQLVYREPQPLDGLAIGRIVRYVEHPDMGGEECAALVTYVFDGEGQRAAGWVNLAVWAHNGTPTSPRCRVPFDPDGAPQTWHWPPREPQVKLL